MATVPKNYRTSVSTVAVASAGPFPLGLRLFDNDGIKVYVNDTARFDWSLSSTYENGYDDAATITFSNPLAVADVLRIDSSLAPHRSEDLVNGDSSLVQKLNVELARIWSSLSEVRRDALRALRGFNLTEPVDGIDLNTIAGAEGYATSAQASASAAAASAALVQSITTDLLSQHRGDWANAIVYLRGDLVAYNGSTYISLVNHTGLTGYDTPETGSNWTEFWIMFASKGAAGAGAGDVLAANAGSEYVSAAGAFRNNISAMLRAITKRASLNFATDTTLDSSIYNIGTGNTQIPSGGGDGDSVVSSKIDASNYNYLWFGNARAWLGRRVANVNTWVELATQAYVDSVRDIAIFSSRFSSGVNGAAFPTASAALVLNTTDRAALSVTLTANQLTFSVAGTYLIEAFVPMANMSGASRSAQSLLYNVTTAAEIGRGQSMLTTNGEALNLIVSAVVAVAAGNQVELRGIANGGSVLNGRAASLGQEIYNIVRVRAL